MQHRRHGAGGGWRAAVVQVNAERKGVVVLLPDLVEIFLASQHLEAVACVESQCRIVVGYHMQIEEAAATVCLREGAGSELVQRTVRTAHVPGTPTACARAACWRDPAVCVPRPCPA